MRRHPVVRLAALAALATLCAGPAVAAPAAAKGAGFIPPIPLGELIATADAVVVGTITSVSEGSFTFQVQRTLAGEVEGTIRVEKFAAPDTTPRWAPHARGQSMVLFLEAGAPRWRIPGRIGEGQIPLDDEHAYFHGRFVEGLPQDHYEVDGRTAFLQRFDRQATLDALACYRRCFAWRRAEDGAARPYVTCPAERLDDYRRRSALHRFLVREAEDRGAACELTPPER